MSGLLLPSLEIQNFRAFEHLRIERLGRVNLITGKNNVGKTSLLEALYLYANNGSLRLIRNVLDDRNELDVSLDGINNTTWASDSDVDYSGVRHLFYQRPHVEEITTPIEIGPLTNGAGTLMVWVDWYRTVEQQDEEGDVTSKLIQVPIVERDNYPEARPYIRSRIGEQTAKRSSLERFIQGQSATLNKSDISTIYVKATGLQSYRTAELWNDISLTPLEEEVVAALRIVAPVKRVGLISEREDIHGPIPIVVMDGHNERLPLQSLGDGMNRLLGLTLALVNVQNGILLVDEIETGLHYSVMRDVWKLIFQVAQRLNVQVFATTHSWDCIEAFQQATDEDKNEEALLIRLENREGSVTPTLFDERKLSIATRELIEVR